jgi:hypothetical protein
MSTSTDQAIQLPPDVSPANKNLLRAIEVDLPSTGATLVQVVVLGDASGNLVTTLHGALAVANDDEVSLLRDIRERLDILIGLTERNR